VVAAGGLAALQVYQSVSAANRPDLTVCTVTCGAHRVLTTDEVIPPQGSVVGIARTARTEFPAVRHVLIDLDAAGTKQRWAESVSRLAAVVGSAPARDAELALRGDRVLLPRLRPGRVPPDAGPARIDPAGWYLVIGGLHGVGLEAARALLEMGARRLVLCGRRPPTADQAAEIERLGREFAAEIRTEAVDVASPERVDRLFAGYSGPDSAVRGVIHAAGLIDDAIIDRTEWSRIARVLAPKAQGAWNLHRSAAKYAPDLELFVLTSSFTGLFGNPGQAGHAAANGFLDALAGHRRGLGLPGLSVNLGSWSDVGLLAGNEDFLRQLEKVGVGTISRDEGRPVLRAAIAGWASGQVALLPIRWRELDPDYHLASNPLIIGLTDAEPMTAEAPAPALPTSDDIAAYCREVVTRELGFEGDELAGLDLAKAGMDSLNALTIRNRLQRRVGVPLPASICFDKPRFGDLVADIEKRVREVRA
jgi:NAD(P)-dependent dehydrogenase (short-subunit alcohol dehydrogenase family)